MNRIKILTISLFIFTLCSLIFLFAIQASSRGLSVISDLSHQSGKLGAYRALIIGINDYKDPKIPDLETAVNDARAMAKLLFERYGFQVKLLLNQKATKEAIYRNLRSLALSTKPDDSILIYYAGHGEFDRIYDDGWWIPADATCGNPISYLENVQIQKSMHSMKARHVLLISDSCYSATLFGKARAMPQVIDDKYYLNLYNEKSRWGMTSGNKTPVSDQGSGGHSVFAYQLLKELRKNVNPYVSTQEIYTRIAPIVGNNSKQTPICRPIRDTGDQGGEFVFVLRTGGQTSVQKSNSVNAEPAQLPSKVGVSSDNIPKAEEAQREAKKTVINGTFIAYATGVVYDKNTGLEWYVGPDRSTNWNEAKRWVENLTVAGGGWRMPTRKQLKTLYKKGSGKCNMTPLLKTTGCWIWSGETKGPSSAWGFFFYGGYERWGYRDSSYNSLRSIAVRSR